MRLIRGRKGLRYWVVVDPRKPRTFDQAAECLADAWCIGIKIHPEEHGYPIAEHAQALFELATRHDASRRLILEGNARQLFAARLTAAPVDAGEAV